MASQKHRILIGLSVLFNSAFCLPYRNHKMKEIRILRVLQYYDPKNAKHKYTVFHKKRNHFILYHNSHFWSIFREKLQFYYYYYYLLLLLFI